MDCQEKINIILGRTSLVLSRYKSCARFYCSSMAISHTSDKKKGKYYRYNLMSYYDLSCVVTQRGSSSNFNHFFLVHGIWWKKESS